MKFYSTAGLFALASTSLAFPSAVLRSVQEDPVIAARTRNILARAHISSADDAAKIFEPIPMFDESQHIDVSDRGPHRFVAPGPTDLRGPCPGLNAFANHGFLPHNGFATSQQFIDATMNVVGMGVGLASFLAFFGSAIDGDGNGWSIGGTPAPSVGGGNGISASHNKYESDASPTRPDLYEFGNDYKVRVEQFQKLSDLQPAGSAANFDMQTLTRFRSIRFDEQIANNPYFFNGPFTGVLVQPAAYTFIYRFMANHSEEHKEGYLSRHVLKSWFSIRGTSGKYKWIPNHERIPYNWYRRSSVYPYDQSYFFADLGNAAKIFPKFASVGGNTGTTNSFTGADIKNLTGGAFSSKSLTKGSNLACLGYQFAAQAKPDMTNSASNKVQKLIGNTVTQFGCPKLTNSDDKQLRMFPGYRKSQRGHTG